MPQTYLNEQGEPIGAAPTTPATSATPTYLDESGNPLGGPTSGVVRQAAQPIVSQRPNPVPHDSAWVAQTKETLGNLYGGALGLASQAIEPYRQVAAQTGEAINADVKNAFYPGMQPGELEKGAELTRFMQPGSAPVGDVGAYAGVVARRIGGLGSAALGAVSAPFSIPSAPIASQVSQILRPAEDLPVGLAGGFKVDRATGRYTTGNEDVDKALQTVGGTIPFAAMGGMHEHATADVKVDPRLPQTEEVKNPVAVSQPSPLKPLTPTWVQEAQAAGDRASAAIETEKARQAARDAAIEATIPPQGVDPFLDEHGQPRPYLDAKGEPIQPAQAPLKITTDNLGVKWASDESGLKVSIPSRIPDSEIQSYATDKLAEQRQIKGEITAWIAEPAKPEPVAETPPPHPMSASERAVQTGFHQEVLFGKNGIASTINDPDLPDEGRAAYTEAKVKHVDALSNLLATADPEAADAHIAKIGDRNGSTLDERVNYLEDRLNNRDEIEAKQQAIIDAQRSGQDVGRNKQITGGPVHPEYDPYGNLIADEAGRPAFEPGAPRAFRDATAKLLGKTQIPVTDPFAKPEGPVSEYIQNAMDERDELADAVSRGDVPVDALIDAKERLKELEGIINKERRPATKMRTIAGPQNIQHGGALKVMNQAIWDADYNDGKTKQGVPDAETEWEKLRELKAQQDIKQELSDKTAEKRILNEKRGEQGGFVGEKPNEDHLKLLGNVDDKYYHELDGQTQAHYQGWITPDRTHFVPTGGTTDLAMSHEKAAVKLLGDEYDPTKGTAAAALMDRNWIRKQAPGEYEVSTPSAKKTNLIETDALNDPGSANRPLSIDYRDKNGTYRSIGVENWMDKGLLPTINRELVKNQLPTFRDEEAGVSGQRILGGMAAGGVTGTAIGGAVAGPVGAVVGGFVGGVGGGIAAAIDFKTAVSNLGTELSELRGRFGYSLEQARDTYKDWLNPVSSDPRISDPMFAMKGEVDRADAHARQAFNGFKQAFFAFPRDMQVKFVDMVKAGDFAGINATFGPDIEDYAHARLLKENELWSRMQEAMDERGQVMGNPPTTDQLVPYLENHDRVMWKKLPGGPDWETRNTSRKLEGTKGMLKQHTLPDMSTGVAADGVPHSWNPVENDFLAWHDTERFIQTTKAISKFIEQHKNDPNVPGSEFVKLGEKAPADYVKVDGTKSKVYFPASSGEGLVHAGDWYMHKDLARMIDNVTGPDYIRNNIIGKTMLGWRRVIGTGMLFGPFHAYLMNNTAMGYKFGTGLRELTNLGIGNADMDHIMGGLAKMATSPLSAGTEFRSGLRARAGEFDPSFWQTPEGAKMKQTYPGVEHYLDLLWNNGASNSFVPQEDVAMHWNETAKQHVTDAINNFSKGRYIQGTFEGAAATGNAAILPIQMAMKPLFETYIPALKLGHQLQDLDIALQEKANDIAQGKTTEAAVARDVVSRSEGFFGELNTDNLFLKKTLRTALTGLYRSFSFRFGSVDRAWAAVKGQSTNLADFTRGRGPLQINPDVAVWSGMLVHAAIGSAVLMKLMAGKNPQNLTDVMHPQIGGLDDRGKPLRADWPSYVSGPLSQMKQNYGLGIATYATGGQSDFFNQMSEAINNRKFDGGYVVDPNEYGKMGQFFFRMSHAIVPMQVPGLNPSGNLPFAMQNVRRFVQSGMPRSKAEAAIALGMSPTRRAEGLTDAEAMATQLGTAASHLPAFSEPDRARYQGIRQIEASIRNNRNDTGELVRSLVNSGQISVDDIDRAITNVQLPYLVYEVQGDRYKRGLDFNDTYTVMKVASQDERKLLAPYMVDKFQAMLDKDPKNANSYAAKLREVMPRGTPYSPDTTIPTELHSPPGNMSDPDTRYAAAQHEAAHAAVGEALQPGSIENMSLTNRGGITNISPPSGKQYASQLTPDETINSLATSLAGGMHEPGGTTSLHASGDVAERHALLGGQADTGVSNLSRLLFGRTLGSDPMIQAPQMQAAATARANLILRDPRMQSAMDNLAGQLSMHGQLTGQDARNILKNGR